MCWLALGAVHLGDVEMAAVVYDRLLPYAPLVGIQGIGAGCHGSLAHWLGRLAATLDRPADAARQLHAAVDVHRRGGMHLLYAHTLVALAEVDDTGNRRGEAARLFRGMGLDHLADRIPARTPAGAPPPPTAEFRREGDYWVVRFAGWSAHLRDSKGVRDIAALLGQPRRDVHVSELVAATEGVARPGHLPISHASTVGDPVLDDRAKFCSYQPRGIQEWVR